MRAHCDKDRIELSRRYTRLIEAIIDLYRGTQPEAGAAATILGCAAQFLAECDIRQLEGGMATRKPVRRHLPAALLAARGGPLAELADAFEGIEPVSDWQQNPNYTTETIGASFLENYGYVELVGPRRTIASDEFLIGFLLLGPDTLYPDHSHAAAEVYHVVAGIAEWWREDRGWTRLPAGTAVAHAPGVRHAMRTGDEPLLALYCWEGEIATAARLSDAMRS
jgi:mannose-6-phosphate isomerase-like protein (cupin superfamily)